MVKADTVRPSTPCGTILPNNCQYSVSEMHHEELTCKKRVVSMKLNRTLRYISHLTGVVGRMVAM